MKLVFWGAVEARGFNFADNLSRELAGRGFALEQYPRDVQFERVGGIRGFCRIVITNVSPWGYQRDAVVRSARPGEQVFFIYRNARYSDQPRWRTLMEHYWRRLNRMFGRAIPANPVLGVVASAECGEEQTKWLEQLALP